MLELIVGVLLAAGATYYVLLPILRPPREPSADTGVGDEGDDPDDDMSPRAVAFRALKEIEFDRATGKLSDTDYESLKAKYTEEALVAMRGEQGAGSREQKLKPAPRSPLPRAPNMVRRRKWMPCFARNAESVWAERPATARAAARGSKPTPATATPAEPVWPPDLHFSVPFPISLHP